MILAILLGILAGLGAFTFRYAEGLAYFSNDPQVCANCHVMNDHLESWLRSSHHTRAVCNDCHAPQDPLGKLITKADNGWNHSVKFTTGNFPEPIRIRPVNHDTVQANCLRCHREFTGNLGQDCIRCHANAGHGPRR